MRPLETRSTSISAAYEANQSRDWRIYAELAQRLMLQARKLYATEEFGVDLNAPADALDSTTIDVCRHHLRALQKPVAGETVLQMD
jgi:broad specificity polyphosphatase/5'/3'-nucleotidase SurE